MHRTRPIRRRLAAGRRPAPGGVHRCDRGSTTVEAAGYTALMLLVILIIVQAAVWALADLSVRHAADHGAQTARVAGGTAQAGHDAAAARLDALNPHGVSGVTITVERAADTTTVIVSGSVLQVVPLLSIPVQAAAHVPTEPGG
jgi:Flp pilus assembly protein TadG